MLAPAQWKVVQLGDEALFLKGAGLSKAELGKGGTQSCIHYGELFTHYGPLIKDITSRSLQVEGGCRSRSGDVLMPGSDVTPRGLATASAVMVDDVLLGGDVIVIRPEPETLWGPYLANVIRWNKQGVLRLVKGSTVYHLHAKDLSDLAILRPPLAEQQAIAEALGDADAAIDALDAVIAKKQDVKRAAMQQLLSGHTRLPGFSEEWCVVSLGAHAVMRSGGTPPTSIDSYYGGGIPWASISDMSSSGKYLGGTERTITHAGLANSPAAVFPSGALLYAMYASIGECCIATVPMATSQAILGIECLPSLNVEFLYYTLTFRRAEIARSGQQGTQANLNAQMVRDTTLLLPSIEEQQAIAEALGDADAAIEALISERDKMRLVKQGMMQELLSGRVRLV